MPDSDKAGRETALKKQRVFQRMGVRSTILDLDQNIDLHARRTDKYDIADWREERKDVGNDDRLAELRGLYSQALADSSVQQFLLVNAEHANPKPNCRYTHVKTLEESKFYLRQVPFAGVFVGRGLMKKDILELTTAILDNGVANVHFSTRDALAPSIYKEALAKRTESPKLGQIA
jgi:hypothetical protein